MSMTRLASPNARPDSEPTAGRDPIRASQHTFRALLTALSTPGSLHPLGVHPAVAQAGPAGNPWLASALVALLDHEVTLAVDASMPARQALVDLLHRRTRTSLASLEQADFVVADILAMDPALPGRLKRGSLEYPDDSATLLVEVESLASTSQAGAETTVRGPGVDGERAAWLPGLTDSFLAARDEANRHYPMGIDLFVIDHAGQVMGLPRTAVVSRRSGGAA
ncbi:MAG: phosphonate C-P lyase system protein PhnH [Chloroflexota bacterium]|nr:phosphonate C-P lyase system protein PhnH [Chloroflexota bacterium]